MRVKLTVESLLPTGEKVLYKTAAERFERAGAVFVRYAEEEAVMGKTITTLKWKDGSLRLMRHGESEMSQLFLPGKTTTGWYRTPFAFFSLRQTTDKLQVTRRDDGCEVVADYRLGIGDEAMKLYQIRLNLEEVVNRHDNC